MVWVHSTSTLKRVVLCVYVWLELDTTEGSGKTGFEAPPTLELPIPSPHLSCSYALFMQMPLLPILLSSRLLFILSPMPQSLSFSIPTTMYCTGNVKLAGVPLTNETRLVGDNKKLVAPLPRQITLRANSPHPQLAPRRKQKGRPDCVSRSFSFPLAFSAELSFLSSSFLS